MLIAGAIPAMQCYIFMFIMMSESQKKLVKLVTPDFLKKKQES